MQAQYELDVYTTQSKNCVV